MLFYIYFLLYLLNILIEIPELIESDFYYLKETLKDYQKSINYFFFIFLVILYSISELGTSIELDNLTGNIYFKVGFFCLIESLTSIGAWIFIMNGKIIKITFIFILIMVFSFGGFIFYPIDSLKIHNNNKFDIFTLFLFIGKFSNELSLTLSIILLAKITEIKYIKMNLSSSTILSKFGGLITPYFAYFSVNYLKIHPFAIYGLLWLCLIFLLSFVKLKESNLNDITEKNIINCDLLRSPLITSHSENNSFIDDSDNKDIELIPKNT